MENVRQGTKPELLPFSERLSLAVTQAGGLNAVLKRFPKARATVDRWMYAQNAPSIVEIAEFAKVLGVSVDWLASGDGQPTFVAEPTSSIPDVVKIPVLDLAAGAGPAVDNGEVGIADYLQMDLNLLHNLGVRPDKAKAARARGVSMEPTINDGALFIINTAKQSLVDGLIYAIITPDGVLIKRIQRQVDGSVLLISDNHDMFRPERLQADDAERVHILGRVVWAERKL